MYIETLIELLHKLDEVGLSLHDPDGLIYYLEDYGYKHKPGKIVFHTDKGWEWAVIQGEDVLYEGTAQTEETAHYHADSRLSFLLDK